MAKNTGFSLIELMITVAIIAILSLMGLPIYNNYTTKVKLTEIVTKHLYLTRQLAMCNSSDINDLYSCIKGMCTAITTESKINDVHNMLECTTAIGLSAQGKMLVDMEKNYLNIILSSPSFYDAPGMDSFTQNIQFNTEGLKWHSILYTPYPKNPDIDPDDPFFTFPYFFFLFAKNDEITPDMVKIIDHNGKSSLASIGHWYCGMMMKNKKIEIAPKSIRPSACRYLSLDGILDNSIEFMED